MASTEKEKAYARDWYHKNKDRLKEKRRAYYQKNKLTEIERVKIWRENNRDKRNEYERKNRIRWENKEVAKLWREKNKEKLSIWYKEIYYKSDKFKTENCQRAANRRRALAGWANKNEISKIYEKARVLTKLTGIKYTVDHIIPIKNDLVCGLHVETNLRIITLSENSVKRNKFEIITA